MSWFSGRVYADAAASTPLSKNAKSELVRLLDIYGNAGALHSEAVAAQNELEAARETIAGALSAHADEIIFTGSGTEANNLALAGVLRPLLREHGELSSLTSPIEHQSILEPLRALEPEGLYVTGCTVNSEGLVDTESFASLINEQTALVSIQLVNSEIGTIQPIKEIAKIIRRCKTKRTSDAPLYFHCDASQAPLWLPLAVESLGVDLLTIDAQKVCGPKGVGALYIKRGVRIEPVIYGGSQERGLRGGTANVPLIGSFAATLKDASVHCKENTSRIEALRNELYKRLLVRFPNIVLNGPSFEHRVANNLNISLPGLEGDTATIALNARGIAVSTRSACTTGEETLSHVLTSVGVPPERAKEAIRITLLPSATKRDVEKIENALAHVAMRYARSV